MDSNRIEEIQKATAYPESQSVMSALLQVWNECGQLHAKDVSTLTQRITELDKEVASWKNNHGDMVRRNAELRHRPDLKERTTLIDSLYDQIEALVLNNKMLTSALTTNSKGGE